MPCRIRDAAEVPKVEKRRNHSFENIETKHREIAIA